MTNSKTFFNSNTSALGFDARMVNAVELAVTSMLLIMLVTAGTEQGCC